MSREADKTVDQVLATVRQHYGLKDDELMDRRHLRERQIAHYLCFRMTRHSFSHIAEASRTGAANKVVANIHVVERKLASDELFRSEVDVLKAKILRS